MGEEKKIGGRKKRKRRRKGKEKKRKEQKERKEKEERKENERRKIVRGGKGKGFRFPVFRQSKVVSPRIKVGILDESYE